MLSRVSVSLSPSLILELWASARPRPKPIVLGPEAVSRAPAPPHSTDLIGGHDRVPRYEVVGGIALRLKVRVGGAFSGAAHGSLALLCAVAVSVSGGLCLASALAASASAWGWAIQPVSSPASPLGQLSAVSCVSGRLCAAASFLGPFPPARARRRWWSGRPAPAGWSSQPPIPALRRQTRWKPLSVGCRARRRPRASLSGHHSGLPRVVAVAPWRWWSAGMAGPGRSSKHRAPPTTTLSTACLHVR